MSAIPILSGIPRQEIIEYFQTLGVQLLDEEENEENEAKIIRYTLENCEIRLFPTKYPANFVISIPRTKIIFQGPENQVTRLVINFRKKFLRGGG